jgi:FkbM family methyltransferase
MTMSSQWAGPLGNSASHAGSGAYPVPTRVTSTPPQPPPGGAFVRGVRAALQLRMPHRVERALDRWLVALNRPIKSVRAAEFRVLTRRATWDEGIVRRIITNRDYTPSGDEIRHDDTVIDIGANIGCFTLLAARAARDGRVLAFEPERHNFQLLARNVGRNGASNAQVFHMAVSGASGFVRLFQGEQGALHSTVPGRLAASAASEEVPAVTLPEIFERHAIARCGFLKLDCEGAEYEILYKTPPEYLQRIDRITLEYHATEDKERVAGELVAYLEGHGFETLEFSDFVGFDCGFIRARRPR